MTSPLTLTNVAPVDLSGTFDGAKALQIQHSSTCLSNHSQQLTAEHEDLNASSGTIRVKCLDFSADSENWQVAVSHLENGTAVSWTRNGNHAYHDFSEMTDAVEVDVLATSTGSNPETKTRKIWIKTTSVDAQPDRP